jgi:hypothetical protein
VSQQDHVPGITGAARQAQRHKAAISDNFSPVSVVSAPAPTYVFGQE